MFQFIVWFNVLSSILLPIPGLLMTAREIVMNVFLVVEWLNLFSYVLHMFSGSREGRSNQLFRTFGNWLWQKSWNSYLSICCWLG